MIDLTSSNAADTMFVQITSMEPTSARSNMIRAFCKTFWSQLSEEHKKAYRQCYANPERFEEPTEAERLAGEAAYDFGMAKQDREMMDY